MKLKDYISGLQQLIKDDPKVAEFPVIYASDDEGNSHHPVHCNGTLVEVEDAEAHYVELMWDMGNREIKPNAVIIN